MWCLPVAGARAEARLGFETVVWVWNRFEFPGLTVLGDPPGRGVSRGDHRADDGPVRAPGDDRDDEGVTGDRLEPGHRVDYCSCS